MDYTTIKIDEYDNLKTVADRLGLRVDELIGFHNLHANKENQILYKDQTHVKTFFVYDWIYNKITDPTLKIPLNLYYKLDHYPQNKTLHYGVMYYLENETVSIKYELALHFTKKGPNFLCQINRTTPVFYNNLELSTIADEVAQIVGQNLYPIQLLINENGIIIDIINLEEIKQRWDQTKQKVYQEYEGKWVEDYLNKCKANLVDKDTVIQLLQKDWFLKTYFSGIYDCYITNFSFQKNTEIPLIDNALPVLYNLQYRIQELWDDDQMVKINVSGNCNDPRSLEEIEYNVYNSQTYTQTKGTYKAKYFLHPKTHTINSLYATANLELNNPITIKVIANIIE